MLFVCEHHQQQLATPLDIPKNDVFLSVYDLKNPEQPKPLKQHVNITELVTSSHNLIATVAPSNAVIISAAKEQQKDQKPGSRRKGQNQFVRHCSQIAFNPMCSKTVGLMIQESPTDSRAILIDWTTMKLKCTLGFPQQQVRKLSFSPADKDLIVTSGNLHLRVWKIVDGQFKAFNNYKMNQ